MSRPPWPLLAAGACVVVAGITVAVSWMPRDRGSLLKPGDATVVSTGESVYRSHCASCHGDRLQGQPRWRERRPDGRLPAPPHDASGHTWHHPDAVLLAITRDGPAALAGGGYESDMPAYGEILSETRILAVLSYIKSTWPAGIQARHDEINARAARR